jgi:uncharacterized protein YgbK (DUF1537 family)
MIRAAVLADDLTGALEVGALLAERRYQTVVSMSWQSVPQDAEAWVIDTETRNSTPEAAADRVTSAAAILESNGIAAMFKKIDSTLRGPIGAELRALTQACGGRRVILAPAYPRIGRTVRGGRLFVDGIELHRTAIADDPRWPKRDSAVAAVLPDPAPWASVRDAETDLELEETVRGGGGAILAGSGGLARAWVRSLSPGSAPPTRPPDRPRRVLLICGSHHPASLVQAHRAEAAGMTVVMAPDRAGDPDAVSRQVEERALETIRTISPDAILFFGGETAARILVGLDVRELRPAGELLPGIPESIAQLPGRAIRVVTKAGAFGSPDVVDEILKGFG